MIKKLNQKSGFSFIEVMVSMTIFVSMMGGVYSMMFISQESMITTQAQMDLRDDSQLVLEKIEKELRASGDEVQIDSNGLVTNTIDQSLVFNNSGSNGTDIIRFAVPLLCLVSGEETFIDPSTDNFFWGAPLTWGCSETTCMDADADCSTIDYRWVEYRKNSSDQLVRRVLNSSTATVREDVLAEDVSDFQIVESVDTKMVTLTITMTETASNGRSVTFSNSINAFLRNNRTNGGG